ncbi:MAG: HAD hydrolase-like protein, partial [Bdellovibrionales bacterium]|nr:HAD hydrolase-like protein [Bdellovibrionales bacterium]
APGMLLEAAEKWNINMAKSFMVGDRLSDIQAGQAAGCASILVGLGEEDVSQVKPDFRCAGLKDAGEWILTQQI